MEAKVDERGGVERVQDNDRLLQELLEYEHNIQSSRHKGIVRMSSSMSMLPDPNDAKLRPDISERTMQNSTVFLKDLKDDLQEDWKTSVEKNMTVFQRKYDLHERQVKELSFVIHEENNRIIRKLSAGPHDRIYDEVRPRRVVCLSCPDRMLLSRSSGRSGERWYVTLPYNSHI